MLDALRRHSQSYIIYLFFGVIIVVFVFFFGPQSDGCSPSQTTQVAEVDGREVLSLQIEQLYARVESMDRGIPEDQRTGPGARRRQLTEDIVLVRLLAREAREAGMNVSDEQFTDYINDPVRNPDFNLYADRVGEFDYERYELSVPGTFGMAIPEYEAWKEDELLARRLLTLLTEAVVVTPEEVEALNELRNTQYDLEYVLFDPEALSELFAVSDAELAAFLANESERVRAWYDEHAEDFQQPRTLRVRRIFIRLPGESDAEGRAEALARYDEALALVTENPDGFADVAAEYSQSTDAEQGGDMGLKPVSDYASYPFLEERIDELVVGEIGTYESAVSRIIFRVEEDNPPTLPPFEDVSEDAARALLQAERDEDALVRELAEWFHAQAQAGMTLEEAALEHARRHAAETGGVDEGEGDEAPAEITPEEAGADVPPADATPEEAAATDATEAETADATEAETADAPETTDETEATDEDEALEPLVDVRRTGLFALDDPGMDLSQFGPQFAGQRSAPRAPTRIPRIGDAPDLARAVPQLTAEAPVAPRVYEVEGGLVVARLAELSPAPELEDAGRASLRDDLWRSKVQELFGFWEARIIFHQPLPLGALLRYRLERAIEAGDADFNDGYFVEPEPEPPASGA